MIPGLIKAKAINTTETKACTQIMAMLSSIRIKLWFEKVST